MQAGETACSTALHLTVHQAVDERRIAVQEVILEQPLAGFPADLLELEIGGLAAILSHPVEDEQNRGAHGVLIGVAEDLLSDGSFQRQFFFEFAGQRRARILPGFHFAAGELPLQGVPIVGLSLADQEQPVPFDDASDHLDWERVHN